MGDGGQDYLKHALLGATFEAATLYIRTCILANGGAVVAWLAYIGSGAEAPKLPAAWFAAGLFLAWIASFVNYFGQRLNWEWARHGFKEDDAHGKQSRRLILTAIVLASLSPIAFIVGGVLAYCEL